MKNIRLILKISLLFTVCLIGCQSEDASFVAESSGNESGVGGSYARFISVGNFMYIVNDTNIKTFDVTAPFNPTLVDEQVVGERIESIFRFQDRLFIGSSIALYIYTIAENGVPMFASETPYFEFGIYPCDPVVANENYAYVTLNSQTRINSSCGGSFEVDVDVLKIYDIANVEQPILISEYSLTAPKGLGLDGDILFICDDNEGLKVFNVADPLNIELVQHINNFTAFDVIPLDGLLLVVGPDNVYQFDYTDINNIQLISTIPHGV